MKARAGDDIWSFTYAKQKNVATAKAAVLSVDEARPTGAEGGHRFTQHVAM